MPEQIHSDTFNSSNRSEATANAGVSPSSATPLSSYASSTPVLGISPDALPSVPQSSSANIIIESDFEAFKSRMPLYPWLAHL
jgi:hypothetical protein